jgi:hypothetical protein
MTENENEVTGLAVTGTGDKQPPASAPKIPQAGGGAPEGTDPDLALPAGDPKGGNPSPEFRGRTSEEVAASGGDQVETTIADPDNEDDPVVALVKNHYAKQYPKNKTFHVTSDMQVFLDAKKEAAKIHQSGLKNGGKVTSITID